MPTEVRGLDLRAFPCVKAAYTILGCLILVLYQIHLGSFLQVQMPGCIPDSNSVAMG